MKRALNAAMKQGTKAAIHLSLCGSAVLMAGGGGASFEVLMPAGGLESEATGVSADGNVVCGNVSLAAEPGSRGFRWTEAGGFEILAGLSGFPGFGFNAVATDISADGTTVAGTVSGGGQAGEAARWVGGEGAQALGLLPNGSVTNGFDVSGDGSVVVGIGNTAFSFQATLWNGAMGYLQAEPGTTAIAEAISADGLTVVGQRRIGAGPYEAFRWTAGSGYVPLGAATWNSSSMPYWAKFDVNGDGTVVVGTSDNGPWRWDAVNGAVVLNPGFPGWATGVSGDGSVVVGGSAAFGGFIWDGVDGFQDLKQYFIDVGMGPAVIDLQEVNATDISADGLTIVGMARVVSGDTVGWVARLVGKAVAGDVTGDGAVNIDDLTEVILAWGPCAGCAADVAPPGGDGVVDIDDLTMVVLNWQP